MYEVIFLWLLALVYIFFAVIQDIKTREIANWLNFSLIIFALGFRLFYSIFNEADFSFFYNGVIGLGIFFAIGNLLYYGKVFAGGDAKLMIALGAIIPYSQKLFLNFRSFFSFFIIFLVVGFVYVFALSFILCIKNFKFFKKEFSRQLKSNKKWMLVLISLSIILLILGFLEKMFFMLGVLTMFSSYLYIYSKSIDESCMVRKIKSGDLKEGDWLYSNLKLGGRILKARWEGVDKKDIKSIIKKYKEIKIRQGVAFSPVFLISFAVFAVFNFLNIKLWDLFW